MDPDAPDPQQAPPPVIVIKKNVTSDERKQIVPKMLTLGQSDGDRMKFPHGTMKAVAAEFHVHPRTLKRVWARAQSNYINPMVRQYEASPKRKGRCGRKKNGILKRFERQFLKSHSIEGEQSGTLLQRWEYQKAHCLT